ncbi:MAG: baseplate protein [Euryarchaeota archaeon]|nr:baseplate protein [Euryarchaeota archaeon]
MALPTLVTPKFKMKLPSDGRVVNYRPFLVKEEKVLLIATETGNQDSIVNAIKDIIASCTDIKDVEALPTFDIEFVFLQIRTKSVGESVDVGVTCPDDNETQVEVKIPLDSIKVKKTKGHSREIKISDEILITMDYPSLDTFVKANFVNDGQDVDQIFEMAASCVKSVTTPEEVHDCKNMPHKEVLEFLDSMSSAQFKDVQQFFETMPKLTHTLKVTNPNTKVVSDVTLEGLASFFG